MNTRRWLGWLGTIAWGASWFLPTLLDNQSFGSNTQPGWAAFQSAVLFTFAEGGMFVAPVDPTVPWTLAGRLTSLFYLASAGTNVLLIVVFIAARRGRARRGGWAWSLIGAGLLNAYWLALFTGDPSRGFGSTGTLGPGYFCWWLSFFVIAFALWPARTHA